MAAGVAGCACRRRLASVDAAEVEDRAIRMARVIAHFRGHMDAGDLVCGCVLGDEADRIVAELADKQAVIPLLRLDLLDEFAARTAGSDAA